MVAEKSAVREPVCQVPVVQTLDVLAVLAAVRLLWEAVQQAWAALDKPGAVPSAERSCADRTPAVESVFAQRVFELASEWQAPGFVRSLAVPHSLLEAEDCAPAELGALKPTAASQRAQQEQHALVGRRLEQLLEEAHLLQAHSA